MDKSFTTIGDEALEARIVAWVLGEASAFEAAELERLCDERPELMIFKRRMLALHGLLTEAEKTDDSWKLPPEKRKAVEDILGEETPVRLEVVKEKHIRRSGRRALLAIAACVVITFFIARLQPWKHTSEAIIEVKPRQAGMSPLGAEMAETSDASRMTPRFFGAENEKIRSRNTLGKVVDRLDLADRWEMDKEQAVAKLKDSIKTENVRGTDLMKIQVRQSDKKEADEIARELAYAYKDYRTEIEAHDAERQLQELNKAVRDQEDKVEERRKVLATIVRNKGIIYKGEDGSIASADESRDAAIKRGLDAQDYADAKRDFESDQQLLQTMKLKQMSETIARKAPSDSVVIHELPESKSAEAETKALALNSPARMKRLETTIPPELIEGTPKPIILPGQAPSDNRAMAEAGGMKKQKQADLDENGPVASSSPVSGSGLDSVTETLEPSGSASLTLNSGGVVSGKVSGYGGGGGFGRPMEESVSVDAFAANDSLDDKAPPVEYNLRRDSAARPRVRADSSVSSAQPMPAAQPAPVSELAAAEKSIRDSKENAPVLNGLRGGGELELGGANTYAGGTIINGGALGIGGSAGGGGFAATAPEAPPTASGKVDDDASVSFNEELNQEGQKKGDGKLVGGIEIVGGSKFEMKLDDFKGSDPRGSVTAGVSRELQYPTEAEPPTLPEVAAADSFPRTPATPAKLLDLEQDESVKPLAAPLEKAKDTKLMEEIPASEEPYSTFSLNISDASFRIAQAALARGEQPDPAGIKVEQFYNAVDYGDPAPAAGEPVACTIEQAAHPVIPGRNLVRVALKTAAAGRSAAQPLRLTLLVDQSGSMARDDRRAAMDKALGGLAGSLTKNDLVNVITFSRTPRLLADGMSGDQAGKLADVINQAASEGGTNLEEAMKLADQLAIRHKQEGAQNRIVLFTDGAANLGDADPERLAQKVKQLRQKGIAFDIAGIAADDLNDALLGELARNGNGRYYVVGRNGDENFAKQLAGAFRPAAENVKVQVRFNPERVARYKLIGFEKDRLKTEDFRNDKVDAAELAAEEAGVAIYQVEPKAEGNGEIGEVSVRFRDTASGEMVERSWTMPHDSGIPAIDRATPSMQLATLAMLAGEKLKGGPFAAAIDFKQLTAPAANVKQLYGNTGRVGEVLRMVDALK